MLVKGIRHKYYSLKTASFKFILEAEEHLILPPYKGSTFRGGFGHAFKRIVCTVRKNECKECLLKEKCIYSYVFNTPPPPNTEKMRKYEAAPHPFIIEPPLDSRREYEPEEKINFSVTLIGRTVDFLPYFIYSFDELGRIGIGKGKGKFILREVSTDGESIYNSETKTLKSFSYETTTLALPSSLLSPTSNKSKIMLLFLTPTVNIRKSLRCWTFQKLCAMLQL